MSTPTNEQWQEIATKLDRMYDPVYLRCDGYLVHAVLRRTEKNKLGIEVGVNGWRFKGVWMPTKDREMSEEARRFWCPRKRQRVTKKELKLWEKVIGKRECRKRGYYDPYIWPFPVWSRPGPLIRHLKKHNKCIEVIDYETYTQEVEAIRAQEEEEEQNA